ncbi:MAG: hypothetical protein MJB12_13865 [Firmicutes bacterium]|nr:hypothetical protein [Bacillota bacterium]
MTPISGLRITQKCLISTSKPSLAFYRRFLSDAGSEAFSICQCLHEETVKNIPVTNHYEIIIDFNNQDIYNIIVKLFNKLMLFDCRLHVKILALSSFDKPGTAPSMKMLRKLEANHLIELEILDSHTETDIKNAISSPLENVTCFIGPGNTGKSAIISSVSELFQNKKQRVALLDLTGAQKLMNYFPRSIKISGSCIDHSTVLPPYLSAESEDHESIVLYNYTHAMTSQHAETASLCKIIAMLGKYYDFVFINADRHILKESIDIFRLCGKIIIVHDCMLTKTGDAHHILWKLHQSGVDTQNTVSIIYNKVEKGITDIATIEENLIFKRGSKGRLIPLIDLQCSTFEILYTKQTMVALNNKFMTKYPAVYETSTDYIKNIVRLYQFIYNNLTYCECADMQFKDLIRHYSHTLYYGLLTNIKRVLKYWTTPRFAGRIEKLLS